MRQLVFQRGRPTAPAALAAMRAVTMDCVALVLASELAVCCVKRVPAAAAPSKAALVAARDTLLLPHLRLTTPLMLLLRLLLLLRL
jgi:hypothetical protein